jgi:serine/threonine-protein kinase
MADSSTTNVPDLSGLTQSAAEQKLRSIGLSIGTITTGSSNTIPVGNVSKTKPTVGASIDVGSAVDLEISSGPADEQGRGEDCCRYDRGNSIIRRERTPQECE